MLELTGLARDIRLFNAEKGFESPRLNITKKLMLVISELCEAQEELRDGRRLTEIYHEAHNNPPTDMTIGSILKPCGFLIELADAAIRMLDIGAVYGIPLSFEPSIWDIEEDVHQEMLRITSIVSRLTGEGLDSGNDDSNLLEALGRTFALANQTILDAKADLTFLGIIKDKLEFNKTRPVKHGRVF